MSEKGTYIFFSYLDCPREIRINKNGRTSMFAKGWYAYVGSAFGPGGLASRLNRHFMGTGKAHWNIDFFRQCVRPCQDAWVSCEDRKLEALWSSVLQSMPQVSIPVANFGNADARSRPASENTATTHLFHFRKRPQLEAFQKQLVRHLPSKGAAPCKIRLPM